MGFLKKLFGLEPPPQATRIDGELAPDFDKQAYIGQVGPAPASYSLFDGEKFPTGFGPTQIQVTDYWTLRQRSAELYNSNLYARGLIRRLVTNEINTGLMPEACPDETVIGVEESSLDDWTDEVESRFNVYSQTPELCDALGESTLGEIQARIRREALVVGDVLITLRYPRNKGSIPQVQLIRGDRVLSPLESQQQPRKGNIIKHGVELDPQGRQVAYWVRQKDGETKRLPAVGEKSGRRLAWLYYGTDKRLDDVRGQPLLSLVMQSLKEIDRYRDSAQRKAIINSFIATYIKKTQDKPGTLPVTGGALRKDTVEPSATADSGARSFDVTSNMPGIVMQELQTGEEPVAFHNQGTDTSFPDFEEAIIAGVAWANEVPPEIMRLAFSNNYSASQAAINEFKIYLNMFWSSFGSSFCSIVYREWLISQALLRRIQADSLLEAWRDPERLDVFGAWLLADWYGSIKPSTDMLKQAKASQLLIEMGCTTRSRESRILTGTKFSKNAKRLRRENEEIADAKRPALELQQEFTDAGQPPAEAVDETELEAFLDEYLEDRVANGE